jgi:pimeloyl-ACP methyl ester carboxylesterase
VRNKEPASAPAARRLDAGGFALAVESLGAGERAFVCLHGLADTRAIFRPLAPGLARLGRVVLVDQRGHGESDAPSGPYARVDLARDVVAVLDGLGLGRAILVGHSMGGVVALATALAHPERVAGLVLLGTTGQCSARIAEWYERIASAGERAGLDGIRREIYGERSRRAIDGDAAGLARMVRMLASLHSDPLTPKLGALRCPALLVVGEKDPMGPKASALLADAIPGAELLVLPGLGHWTHVEAPEQVLAAVLRWLPKTQEGVSDE